MTEIEIFNIKSKWVQSDKKRIDARYYREKNIAAKMIIDQLNLNGIKVDKFKNYAENIYWLGRFKKNYTSKKFGNKYLTASEAFMFIPKARKFIFNFPIEKIVADKTILITRSASLGRSIIVNHFLTNFKISDDLVRVVLKENSKIGYLYAYLNTWVGKTFLTMNKYGKTVKHIESNNIENVPIPIISSIEEEINQKMFKAFQIRNKAQNLLLKALDLLYSELKLPRVDNFKVKYFGGKNGEIVKSSTLNRNELNSRIDASYHNPILNEALNILKSSTEGKLIKLENLADIFLPPRFKRIYTKETKDGIPLLQGSHITQIKPLDIQYLWKRMKNIKAYIIKENWILITCSGTIGRLSLVSKYWDNWTATNHLLRVIPNTRKINSGYLTAFLLSDYGQLQLNRLSYGGVIDEIGEAGNLFNDILILKPDDDKIEKQIGKFIKESFDKKDEAVQIEDECSKSLESELEKYYKSV